MSLQNLSLWLYISPSPCFCGFIHEVKLISLYSLQVPLPGWRPNPGKWSITEWLQYLALCFSYNRENGCSGLYYIDGFLYIETSLDAWDEAYLIVFNDGFDMFLNLVGKNFLSIFASVFVREIVLKFWFIFSLFSLCGLGISVDYT